MIDSDLVESIPAKIKNNIIKVPATAIANNNNNNKGMLLSGRQNTAEIVAIGNQGIKIYQMLIVIILL